MKLHVPSRSILWVFIEIWSSIFSLCLLIKIPKLTHTHTHTHTPFCFKGIMQQACAYAQSLGRIWLFGSLWTVAFQSPLSMEFSRQKYWSGLPFPPPRDPPRDWSGVSCISYIGRCIPYDWATRKPHNATYYLIYHCRFFPVDCKSSKQKSWCFPSCPGSFNVILIQSLLPGWPSLRSPEQHLYTCGPSSLHVPHLWLLPSRSSAQPYQRVSAIWYFFFSYPVCGLQWGFFIVYLFYLGGCGWGTEDVFSILSIVLGTVSHNLSKFFFFFWSCHVAFWISVPQPRLEPGSRQWKCWVLATGPPGSSL